jgi:hypothetical protein
MSLAILLAPYFQQDDGGAAALIGSLVPLCCGLIVLLVVIAGLWKVFEKAGQPGWAAIIPIYNNYIMQQIVGRETWWLIFLFIPGLQIVWTIVIGLDMAKSFGKETLWAIGLILFPYVFYPLLGFGDSKYVGPMKAF